MQNVSADGRLELDGALTIRTAVAVCTMLRETVAQYPVVSIDCTAAETVDLSFIQLLIAARAGALRSGKTVTLAQRPAGPLLEALSCAGFHVTDEERTEVPSFWFDGAAE